ncbi:MAG: glycosyltransferase family 4 protein [Clostridiaceae bacterium]|nr:glycosyltransferase family 4 protein [Clostridiaceae bacterium]
MKVLMYIREDYKQNMAGDSIQFIKTQEHLKKLGVKVDISSDANKVLEGYDLIHLFNTIRITDTYKFYLNALKYRKKIVLTPIYWNYAKYFPNDIKHSIKKAQWKKWNSLRKEVFEGADIILPSAQIEMEEIQKDLTISKPYRIIRNGVDRAFLQSDRKTFYNKYNIDNFVLSVARICPHKNQLALAKITKKLGVPLVLIGTINDYNYYTQCVRANKDIVYIPQMKHHDLASAYTAARAHALVSWYEIPGLVNLEAGLAGCNVITTEEGSGKEYFKNYVQYVKPFNLKDIEEKLIGAITTKQKQGFKEYILNNFLWEKIAQDIINSYKVILKI